jgi:hypothetical protein
MSSDQEHWLNPDTYKGHNARRFAEFCLQNKQIEPSNRPEYKDAVELVLKRLETYDLQAGKRK